MKHHACGMRPKKAESAHPFSVRRIRRAGPAFWTSARSTWPAEHGAIQTAVPRGQRDSGQVYFVGWGGGGGGKLSFETHAERSKKRNSSALSWALSGGPAQTPGMLPIGLPPA
jgi:hypothetical protein